MTTSYPMNDGNSAYSYFNNSQRQKELIDASKDMVRDAIIGKLDVEEKYHNIILEFQVFFSDHVENDFNTLFRSFPYASRVLGSFHGRLFPSQSIHFAHSSCAIHWLSKIPKELLDEKSPTWNKGLIHYGTSNIDVVNAYIAQFEKDMEIFFNTRAEEIVPG
ncbi:probable S-adenosylmethionine-dependent methyltransferase At5g38100 [Solanum tuberosum]|uniref:probable S-adenosylmethionine-dependent methyltransferase At5g38100 n=1 Tax=Solanum tuberosum TaxID=4113 RepID=UPI00073A1EA2|nr:PREDICTED: probable S-adenosylmethionine-dependent methyltransferase At5g38100 [Solanum tuberosum]